MSSRMRPTTIQACCRYVASFCYVTSNNKYGPSRPWSDRYLFLGFNASQRLSIRFNSLQHYSTSERLTVLKRVEQLSAVTFRTSLEGRSTPSVGRESHGVKRSARVQAFTCHG